MQVNRNNYNKNNLAFGSRKIMPVSVRDMNDKPVKAWFSRLRLSDSKDATTMKKVYFNWYHQQRNKYSDEIYYKFLDKKPVYAIELDGNENLYERLLCLACIRKIGKNCRLDLIQAAPSSMHESAEPVRKYKYAGTALVNELVKIAYKAKMKRFEADSRCDSFFDFIGMKQRGIYKTFNREEMNCFIKEHLTGFNALLKTDCKNASKQK